MRLTFVIVLVRTQPVLIRNTDTDTDTDRFERMLVLICSLLLLYKTRYRTQDTGYRIQANPCDKLKLRENDLQFWRMYHHGGGISLYIIY